MIGAYYITALDSDDVTYSMGALNALRLEGQFQRVVRA